jgi:predicted DNA-binding transcriptional regulator AlpA
MNDATADHARPTGRTAQPVPLSLSIDPGSMTRLLDLLREALEPMIAKVLIQAQAGTIPSSRPAEMSPSNSATMKDIDLAPTSQTSAANLRSAVLLGKIPEDTGLLIDARTFACLLNVSQRHVWRLLDEKAIPEPVRLGRLVRWRLPEILEWIEASCPPQEVWVRKRQDSARTKGR